MSGSCVSLLRCAGWIAAALSCSGLLAFFISTGRAFKKFDSLDVGTQGKLALLDYYMAAVRALSKDDLRLLGRLPDEALLCFNATRSDELPQAIRKMLTAVFQAETVWR